MNGAEAKQLTVNTRVTLGSAIATFVFLAALVWKSSVFYTDTLTQLATLSERYTDLRKEHYKTQTQLTDAKATLWKNEQQLQANEKQIEEILTKIVGRTLAGWHKSDMEWWVLEARKREALQDLPPAHNALDRAAEK